MATAEHASDTSQAAIFARLWEAKDGKLPRTLARHVLKLGFSKFDRARMHDLAERNQLGALSATELEELDNYIATGDLLALLQSKARQALRPIRPRRAPHG